MTHTTEQDRAAYERELIDNHHYVPSDFSFKDGFYDGDDDYIQFGWDLWQAARRAPAVPVPQGYEYDMIDRFLRNNLHDDDYAEYSAALDELAAAPQPPEAAQLDDIGVVDMAQAVDSKEAASVQLPEPVAKIEGGSLKWHIPDAGYSLPVRYLQGTQMLYTEQQVRELLAAHGIEVAP